jgi:hypothetical protein
MSHKVHTPNTAADAALRSALQGLATDIAAHHAPPPASTVWLRSQRRARQLAIARATLPLRIMSTISLTTAIAVAAFLAYHSSGALPGTSAHILLDYGTPALAFLLISACSLFRLNSAATSLPQTASK